MFVTKIDENKEVDVKLCLSQVKNIAQFIELYMIDILRNDVDIDNFMYVCDMCDAYRRLNEVLQKEKENERS